jgi:hypothetical protein
LPVSELSVSELPVSELHLSELYGHPVGKIQRFFLICLFINIKNTTIISQEARGPFYLSRDSGWELNKSFSGEVFVFLLKYSGFGFPKTDNPKGTLEIANCFELYNVCINHGTVETRISKVKF